MARATPAFTTIGLEVRDQVALVILDRPLVQNAFNGVLVEDLTRALKFIDRQKLIRAVVLMGAGESFCAGYDLEEIKRSGGTRGGGNVKDAAALGQMLFTLAALSKPTIARVQGLAEGDGVGLVACCDIAIAAQDAEFGFSEVRLGMTPATSSPYIVGAIGARHARRYFVTGERFTAAEAYRIGLVHDIVRREDLDMRINELLIELLQSAPEAIAQCKELVRDVSRRPVSPALIADTAQRLAQVRAGAEAREGVNAYLEKRAPAWLLPPPSLSVD